MTATEAARSYWLSRLALVGELTTTSDRGGRARISQIGTELYHCHAGAYRNLPNQDLRLRRWPPLSARQDTLEAPDTLKRVQPQSFYRKDLPPSTLHSLHHLTGSG